MSSPNQEPYPHLAADREFVRQLAHRANLDRATAGRADGSDAAQDALLKAIETYGQALNHMTETDRRVLLRQILSTIIIDLVRHHQAQMRDVRRQQTPASSQDSGTPWEHNVAADTPTPLALVERDEEIQAMTRALEKLTGRQRDVVLLRDHLDLGYREVGELLCLTTAQAAHYYRAGIARLHELLTPAEPNP